MIFFSENIPNHVAIVMDGNGRWAEKRGYPRFYGHIEGCKRVREIIREADKLGIKSLTLFAFSTENWNRPAEEIQVLMRLLSKWLIRERKELMANRVCFNVIGNIMELPQLVLQEVLKTKELSKNNSGLKLTLALSYGGRAELVQAARHLAQKVSEGRLLLEDITENTFINELFTKGMEDPDLLIRTSGEQRISNFLLWQCAYSELYFTPTLWPEFKPLHLQQAVEDFKNRKRRFGLTQDQVLQKQIKSSTRDFLRQESDKML